MALSYKKNSNDFMDEVMRELEVCVLYGEASIIVIKAYSNSDHTDYW